MKPSERDLQPVTVVFTWDVIPGHEREFETWAHGVNDTATGFPGHLGTEQAAAPMAVPRPPVARPAQRTDRQDSEAA